MEINILYVILLLCFACSLIFCCSKRHYDHVDADESASWKGCGKFLYRYSCCCPNFVISYLCELSISLGEIGLSCQSTIYSDDAELEAANLVRFKVKMKDKKKRRKNSSSFSENESQHIDLEADNVSVHSDTPIMNR